MGEQRRRVAVLSRWSGTALADTLATGRSLMDVADPELPDPARAAEDAEARSPELRKARLGVEVSGLLVALARKDFRPDPTVSAGLMPRWGPYSPMWQAGVLFSVPLWAGSKQSRAVAESRWQGTTAESGAEAVRQLLDQRVEERLAALQALLETNRLYRAGLLAQSEATVTSTVVQYQVGRVSFASVLEALTGYVGDTGGFLESVAAAQRVDIAQREVSLEPVAAAGAAVMGGTPVPGAGGMGSGSSARTGPAGPAPGAVAGAGSMSRM
jgi:outer membrane protein TolC